MKKTLSLFLAVVMVAMMIPFATLTTVADDFTSYTQDFTAWGAANANSSPQGTLTLPEGYLTSGTTGDNWNNAILSDGFHIAGNSVLVMAKDAGTDTARVVKVTLNTSLLFAGVYIGSTGVDNEGNVVVPAAGVALTTGTYSANRNVYFSYMGGPKNDAAFWSGSNSDADNGGNFDFGGYATTIYKNGDTNTNIGYAGLKEDSAYQTAAQTGKDFNIYLEIGADNVLDYVHVEYEGGQNWYTFVPRADKTFKGGLFFENNGWDNNTEFTVKSVKVTKGTFAQKDTAEAIINDDMSTWGANGNLTDLVLPEGWGHANAHSNRGMGSTVDAHGVTITGNEGIYTTANIGEGTNRVVSVKFNTMYKYSRLYIGFGGPYNRYSTANTAQCVGLFFVGGPNNRYVFNTAASRAGKEILQVADTYSTEVKYNGEVVTADSPNHPYNALQNDGILGKDMILSIEIVDDVVSMVYLQCGQDVWSFTPAKTLSAKGCISIWDCNWGTDNQVAIKSVSVTAGSFTKSATEEDIVAAGKATLETVNEETGVSFTTKMSAADLQHIVDVYELGLFTKVQVGTLITTKEWVDAAGDVTFEALDAVKGEDDTAYLDIVSDFCDLCDVNTFASTVYTDNTELEYYAVGYMKVTLHGGKVVLTFYTDVTTATLASLA